MGVTKRNESLAANINIEGVFLNQMTKFRNLESLVTDDARRETEIKARLGMAKTTFGTMRHPD